MSMLLCPRLLIAGHSREYHDNGFKVQSYRGVCTLSVRHPPERGLNMTVAKLQKCKRAGSQYPDSRPRPHTSPSCDSNTATASYTKRIAQTAVHSLFQGISGCRHSPQSGGSMVKAPP
ncbi:hypothetical protein MRX96_002629 [Rhipicephalus microplus]